MNKKDKVIAFVAGNSGGHIVPCATIAQNYKNNGFTTIFFSANTNLDKHILGIYNCLDQVYNLDLDNIPKKKLYKLPKFIYQLFSTFFKSFKILRKNRPEALISSGGYIALPVCLAAKILKIPIDFYELNVTPGKAIQFLSPLARKNYICFSKTADYLKNTEITKYPIRFKEEDKLDISLAHKKIGLDPNKKTILILGGSQGSNFINKLILDWLNNYSKLDSHNKINLKNNLGSKIQIIHQAGNHDINFLIQEYSNLNISAQVFAYNPDIYLSYSAADFIIARAGSGTLFEISFFSKKALLIPLETQKDRHQVYNAQAIIAQYPEQFKMFRQSEIKPEDIQEFISNF